MLAPLWSDLTSWLVDHAPRTLEGLKPAGDPARIVAAEQQLGFPLGAELTEWWHLHDGNLYGHLVPGYELNRVSGMLSSRQVQLDVNFEEEVNAMAGRRLGLADEADGLARLFPREFAHRPGRCRQLARCGLPAGTGVRAAARP